MAKAQTPTASDDNGKTQAKVALVTGGAKRVGRAVALKLAGAGYDVAITYQTSAAEARSAVEAIQQIGRRAVAIRADLAQPGAVEKIHTEFTRHFDRLDALINNASIFAPSPLATLTEAEFDRHMTINAKAPLFLIQRFAAMLGAHYRDGQPATMGRVVNFIDIHVLGQTLRNHVAYNASKAALLEITATMAMDLAPKVTVNAIAPGVVAWAESYTEAERKAYMRRVPLGRPGTPEDAATAVLFLVRDADYCIGQVIRLDGGRFLT